MLIKMSLLLNALSKYDMTVCDKDNNTLLHTQAAKFPDSKLIKPELKAQLFDTLIANIDVNAQNIMGETPSDMASDKLIVAYLKMAESIQPQKVATQMAARQMADRQNTMA